MDQAIVLVLFGRGHERHLDMKVLLSTMKNRMTFTGTVQSSKFSKIEDGCKVTLTYRDIRWNDWTESVWDVSVVSKYFIHDYTLGCSMSLDSILSDLKGKRKRKYTAFGNTLPNTHRALAHLKRAQDILQNDQAETEPT